MPLVATLADDDDEDDLEDKRWNHHQPNSGAMPEIKDGGDYAFPAMFLYPGHGQSDFVSRMEGGEMVALRLAEMFPEERNDVPWDYDDSYKCSELAVYFEVYPMGEEAVHPAQVRMIDGMAGCMRFFENSRALKGGDGQQAMEKAKKEERAQLVKYRKAWAEQRGKHAPAPVSDVVRVHPAATLDKVLTDSRFIVPNFLVTFLIFPESHPSHAAFVKERRVLGLIEP